MFGGVQRITGDAFLVEVQRDAATLLPIIQKYIRYVVIYMLVCVLCTYIPT